MANVTKKIKEEFLVERHVVRELVLYEATEDELDSAEKEALSLSESLTFAIVGLTVGISFAISLCTTTIQSDRVFEAFFIVTIAGFVVAAFFSIAWWRSRGKFRSVFQKIRGRAGPLGREGRELETEVAVLEQTTTTSTEGTEPR